MFYEDQAYYTDSSYHQADHGANGPLVRHQIAPLEARPLGPMLVVNFSCIYAVTIDLFHYFMAAVILDAFFF